MHLLDEHIRNLSEQLTTAHQKTRRNLEAFQDAILNLRRKERCIYRVMFENLSNVEKQLKTAIPNTLNSDIKLCASRSHNYNSPVLEDSLEFQEASFKEVMNYIERFQESMMSFWL